MQFNHIINPVLVYIWAHLVTICQASDKFRGFILDIEETNAQLIKTTAQLENTTAQLEKTTVQLTEANQLLYGKADEKVDTSCDITTWHHLRPLCHVILWHNVMTSHDIMAWHHLRPLGHLMSCDIMTQGYNVA